MGRGLLMRKKLFYRIICFLMVALLTLQPLGVQAQNLRNPEDISDVPVQEEATENWYEAYDYELDEEGHYLVLKEYTLTDVTDVVVPGYTEIGGQRYQTLIGDERNSVISSLWDSDRSIIESITLEDGVKLHGNCSYLFSRINAKQFNFGNIDTSEVTYMWGMFEYILAEYLDLTSFDTSNVESMGSMFYFAINLRNIDLSSFNTSKVTNMSKMFQGCNQIREFDLKSFNTSNVTSFADMFAISSYYLDEINILNFDMSKSMDSHNKNIIGAQQYMSRIFIPESFVDTYYIQSLMNIVGLTDIYFGGSEEVWNKHIEDYESNIQIPEYIDIHFEYSEGDIPAPSYEAENPDTTDWYKDYDYYICDSKKTIIIYKYLKEEVTDIVVPGYTEIDGTIYRTVLCNDFYSGNNNNSNSLWESSASTIQTITFKNGVALANTASYLFDRLIALKDIDFGKIDTSECRYMSCMFEGCISLDELDLSEFDTSRVLDMTKMFKGCVFIRNINLNHIDTSRVLNMDEMFSGCEHLNILDLGSFSTINVYSMSKMFQGANVEDINISSFDTSNLRIASYMFDSFAIINQVLDTTNFSYESVTSTFMMYYNLGFSTLRLSDGYKHCGGNSVNGSESYNDATNWFYFPTIIQNDIYYTGSEDQWNELGANYNHNNIMLHYDYVPNYGKPVLSTGVIKMDVGDTAPLTVTLYDGDGRVVTDVEPEFLNIKESVATYEDGVVTAIAPGRTVLRFKYDDHYAVCSVQVKGITQSDPAEDDDDDDEEENKNPLRFRFISPDDDYTYNAVDKVYIFKVSNTTKQTKIDIEVAPEATWELYTDYRCTEADKCDHSFSLKPGNNVRYIKVVNGEQSAIYTVLIDRDRYNLKNLKLEFAGDSDNVLWGDNLFDHNSDFYIDSSSFEKGLAIATLYLSDQNQIDENAEKAALDKLGFSENKVSKYYSYLYTSSVTNPAYSIGAKKIDVDGVQDKLVVAISVRGTRGDDFFLMLADLLSKDVLGGGLAGFLPAGQSTYDELNKYINANYPEYTKSDIILIITGHSLGGAVAGQIARLAYNDGYLKKNTYCYTYASPKYNIENNNPADFTNVFNVIHDGDIVPTVPWWFSRIGTDRTYANLFAAAGMPSDILSNHLTSAYFWALKRCNMISTTRNGVRVSVSCPVDIKVYDSKNILVGETKGEQAYIYDNSNIYVGTKGDKKFVYTTDAENFHISFTGTDKGLMEYEIENYNIAEDTMIASKKFVNVNLEKGKTFKSELNLLDIKNTKLYVTDENGKAILEVTSDGHEDSIEKKVKCVEENALAEDGNIYEYVVTLTRGGKATIPALAKAKADGKNYKIEYTNKKASVMSRKGVIKGKNNGSSIVTITKGDVKHVIYVAVTTPKYVDKKLYINKGEGLDSAFVGTKLVTVFSVKNDAIATVSENGFVTGVSKGKTMLTVTTDDGKKYKCSVQVCDQAIAGKDTVNVGKSIKLKVKYGVKATTWTSSNPSIATVSEKGKVTGVAQGDVVITAVNNGKTITKSIHVN